MIVMSGIVHFQFRVMGHKRNKLSVLYAYLDCITKNKTAKDICEAEGRKPWQVFNGTVKTKYSNLNKYL